MNTPKRFADRHQPEALILASVLALIAFYYLARADTIGVFSPERGWFPLTGRTLPAPLHFALSALVLGVLPTAAAVAITRRKPAELGLGLGRWRAGLGLLAVGIPLAVIAGWIGADSAAMRAVYPLDPTLAPDRFPAYAAAAFLYFAAWEVLFRGVILFGLARTAGEGMANTTQTALSVTAHFGRALTETFSALPAGLVFGFCSYRLGSIWYIAIIHWVVGMSMEYAIIT